MKCCDTNMKKGKIEYHFCPKCGKKLYGESASLELAAFLEAVNNTD